MFIAQPKLDKGALKFTKIGVSRREGQKKKYETVNTVYKEKIAVEHKTYLTSHFIRCERSCVKKTVAHLVVCEFLTTRNRENNMLIN